MSNHVEVNKSSGILSIVLNRAEIGNLVSAQMIGMMTEAVKSVTDEVRLVMIRGKGADFCKGRDYGAAPEDARDGRKPSALQIQEKMTGPIIDLYLSLHGIPVPTVAVVQGVAAGFGCALSCACDIVVASDDATFSLPEMHERGLPPSLAMTALFERVNLRMLTYMVFGTQPIGAKEALAAGLVSCVGPKNSLTERADTLAGHICSLPADSVRAVKNYLKHASQMEPRGRAALGAGLYAVVAGSR